MQDSLETLMSRYQAGDFIAARFLIDRVSPQLCRFLGARAASRADADDLLQDTWLRIHRARHTYRPQEPLLPWLYGIARRARADHYRATYRISVRARRLAELPGVAASPGEPPDDELQELLAPLSESQREVIELLKVAGLSLEEVARATSTSVGAVKQKAHRAYKKMREKMRSVSPAKRPKGAQS